MLRAGRCISTRATSATGHAVSRSRARDAAGNERVVEAETPVSIANEPDQGLGSASAFALSARFGGASSRTLTVSFGRRVSVRGRLTRSAGQLAAGSPIKVLERLDRAGARERSTRTVMTKADGSFSLGLATRQPPRTIRLAYHPSGGARIVSRILKLRVRSASRVHASLRGRSFGSAAPSLAVPIPARGSGS
jgi:hypothetical protein